MQINELDADREGRICKSVNIVAHIICGTMGHSNQEDACLNIYTFSLTKLLSTYINKKQKTQTEF